VNDRSTDQPQQPRSEPEIIPPGQPTRRSRAGRSPFGPGMGFDASTAGRIYVFRPRPLAALIAALAIGGAALALVVVLLGAVLVALPVIGAIAAIGLLAAFLRGGRRELP
jgi:hypothetical protein